MVHFPHVNANHVLTPSRQARLPILNGQRVYAILCPRHLDRGIHIALEPKCDRTCKAFDWAPDNYAEIAPQLLPPVPHPVFGPLPPAPPPFRPAQDPVRVNAFFDYHFDADPFQIHFPSSSPPDRARNTSSPVPSSSNALASTGFPHAPSLGQQTVLHNGPHSSTQVPSSSWTTALPPPPAPPSSLPLLTATSGGCTAVYAHRSTTQQKEIDRRTKRATNFIPMSPPALSLPSIPSSVGTLATLIGADLPSRPASTATSSSSSQPAPTATSSSSTSTAQHRYAESLDPTWAAWRGERMCTREKAFQEHEAQRAKNVVDMVNFNVIVWTVQDESFIELERQVARRLSRSWSFGEDPMLCKIVGLNKATKCIYKYTKDREGNCRWTTVEFTHAFPVNDNGYYLFACYNLDTASLVNFRQVASLVAPPSRNLMNRRPPRHTVEVVVPTLELALKRTYRHVPTPESPVAKRLKPDQAPTGSPEKPIDVDLEPDSTSTENADPDRSVASVDGIAADAILEPAPNASNRLWPHQYSVHDVIKGFRYIDSTLGRLPDKFRNTFGTQFVKATYHTYRNAWNNLDDERRKEILALPDNGDALFHKLASVLYAFNLIVDISN
ncbi:hypothetical protein M407DRAFT_12951 [Tulasnella calospora MUT 4182]|uniref:Uncharacterized protein n=1 Tax=Tulasnella calospora MUT 4182 TaxID=1051891 RepID=A0A0C3PNZ9_9AGAM|nr:hypothetical protein M407DRAFT_12951 [Tulasnella calospora MUT 4182]